MVDFGTLSMTEIIRLQNLLQQELTRRFERYVALGFSDIVGSTPYCERFGDAAGRRQQQLHIDLLNECLPPSQGRIVDTAGDGAFMAFSGAEAAIAALIEFHKRISRENASRSREHQPRFASAPTGAPCWPTGGRAAATRSTFAPGSRLRRRWARSD